MESHFASEWEAVTDRRRKVGWCDVFYRSVLENIHKEEKNIPKFSDRVR